MTTGVCIDSPPMSAVLILPAFITPSVADAIESAMVSSLVKSPVKTIVATCRTERNTPEMP